MPTCASTFELVPTRQCQDPQAAPEFLLALTNEGISDGFRRFNRSSGQAPPVVPVALPKHQYVAFIRASYHGMDTEAEAVFEAHGLSVASPRRAVGQLYASPGVQRLESKPDASGQLLRSK